MASGAEANAMNFINVAFFLFINALSESESLDEFFERQPK
jgi:hypothetical protein